MSDLFFENLAALRTEFVEPALDRFVSARDTEEVAEARDKVLALRSTVGVSLVAALNDRLGPEDQIQPRRGSFSENIQRALDSLREQGSNTLRVVSGGTSFVRPIADAKKPGDPDFMPAGNKVRVVEKSDRLSVVVEALREMDIDISSLPDAQAEVVPDFVWRQTPYVLVRIPELDRSVLVCDERGNRTFVIYSADETVLAEIFGEDGINKDLLDDDPRIEGFIWRSNRDAARRHVAHLLGLDEAPKEDDREVFVGDNNGIASVTDPESDNEREVVFLSMYARFQPHYSLETLEKYVATAGLEPTGLLVKFPVINTDFTANRDTYWRDEVDAIMPILLDNNGIGSLIDGETTRNVVSLNPYLKSKQPHKFKNGKNFPRLLAAAEVSPVEGRLGKMVRSSRATPIYWQDEIDDALERSDELLKIHRMDERGVVTPPINGREAVVRIPYAGQLGIPHRRLKTMLNDQGVEEFQPRDLGVTVLSGVSSVKRILWKDEVDKVVGTD